MLCLYLNQSTSELMHIIKQTKWMKAALSIFHRAINLPTTQVVWYHNGSLSFCHHSEQRQNISLLEEQRWIHMGIDRLSERRGVWNHMALLTQITSAACRLCITTIIMMLWRLSPLKQLYTHIPPTWTLSYCYGVSSSLFNLLTP